MARTANLTAETSKQPTKAKEKAKEEIKKTPATRQPAVVANTADKTKNLTSQTTTSRPNISRTMPNTTPAQPKEPIGDHGKVKKIPDIACECHSASGTGAAPSICPLHTPVNSSTGIRQQGISTQESKEVGCSSKSINLDIVSENRNSAGATKLQLNATKRPEVKDYAMEHKTLKMATSSSSNTGCSSYGTNAPVKSSEIPLIRITSRENNITVNICSSDEHIAVGNVESLGNTVRNICITTSSSNIIVSIDSESDSQSSSSITDIDEK